MKRRLFIIIIFLYISVKSFSQQPIIIWENLTFYDLRPKNIGNIITYKSDSIIKDVELDSSAPGILLKGRIINNTKKTMFIRNDAFPTPFFKIVFIYKKRKNIINLSIEFNSENMHNIKLEPNGECEIILNSDMKLFNDKIDPKKINYLKEVLEIIPTIIIKGRIGIDNGDPTKLLFYNYESNEIANIELQWRNFKPIIEFNE